MWCKRCNSIICRKLIREEYYNSTRPPSQSPAASPTSTDPIPWRTSLTTSKPTSASSFRRCRLFPMAYLPCTTTCSALPLWARRLLVTLSLEMAILHSLVPPRSTPHSPPQSHPFSLQGWLFFSLMFMELEWRCSLTWRRAILNARQLFSSTSSIWLMQSPASPTLVG